MRILWVATKPPWPPIDGGRLLVDGTLRGLAAAGARITLVAPATASEPTAPSTATDPRARDPAALDRALGGVCELRLVSARRPPLASAVVAGLRQRLPLTVARHALPAVRAAVAELCSERRFDLIHAEQVQALWAASAATGLPRVWRAQNVESDLWAQAAELAGLGGPAMAWEARRLARWEAESIRSTDLTLALTEEDRRRLLELSGGGGRLQVVAAPFAEWLPDAGRALSGAPAIVLLGSAGWLPNRLAGEQFLRTVWPRLRHRLAGAELHVFGDLPVSGGAPALSLHPSPKDSRQAFAPGSILVVPLRVASGVRMKILEAWARGIPVVASPAAARGLGAEDGRELLLAEDPAGFVAAIERLSASPEMAGEIVRAGRRRLRANHAPARLAARLMALYESVATGTATAGSSISS